MINFNPSAFTLGLLAPLMLLCGFYIGTIQLGGLATTFVSLLLIIPTFSFGNALGFNATDAERVRLRRLASAGYASGAALGVYYLGACFGLLPPPQQLGWLVWGLRGGWFFALFALSCQVGLNSTPPGQRPAQRAPSGATLFTAGVAGAGASEIGRFYSELGASPDIDEDYFTGPAAWGGGYDGGYDGPGGAYDYDPPEDFVDLSFREMNGLD